MSKIKVSELAPLDASKVNKYTSLLAVDNNHSYQLKYGFLSSNLSSNLYRPITETVSAECDIQQQKDDITALYATSESLCAEIQLSTQTLASEIDNKIDKTTIATSTNLGLIKVGYDTDLTAKNYAVQLTEENKAYVHVPWESGSGGSGDYDDVRKTVQDISATTIPDIKFNITELSDSTVNTDYQSSLVNRLSLVEDETDEIGNFIDEIIDKTSGLYNVGCIYMTTNDVNDTISNLSRIINVYNEETDEETPSEWEEVDTVLSDNGIHILKRTA